MTEASLTAETTPVEHRHGVSLGDAFRVWIDEFFATLLYDQWRGPGTEILVGLAAWFIMLPNGFTCLFV